MLQLRIDHEGRSARHPLEKSCLRIGSAPDNDIIVAVPGVSAHHAELRLKGSQANLRDLGSKNGFFLQGDPCREAELEPGMKIQMGHAFLSVEEGDPAKSEIVFAWSGSTVGEHYGRTTDSVESPQGPRAALRLLREIRQSSLDEQRQKFLDQACVVLGVDQLIFFEIEADDLVILAQSGPLASAAHEAALTRLKRTPYPQACKIEGIECRRIGGAPGHGLAIFGTIDPEDVDWVDDVLIYLFHAFGELLPEEVDLAGERTPQALDPPPGMVLGSSPEMVRLLEEMRVSLVSRHNVLLRGETGTGKELFAELLHRSGPRRDGPFVAINCAAIPAELLEAELFGIGKGVATSVEARDGHFVSADGGTLLLDEIADLPLPLQSKLLRALETGTVTPLGESRPRTIDVRIIATCHADLAAKAEENEFRQDLYHRLHQLDYEIPPLRERREDIPPLVLDFIRRAMEDSRDAQDGRRHSIRGIDREALEILQSRPWPGNVRELKGVIIRAVPRCLRGGVLRKEHLGEYVGTTEENKTLSSPRPLSEEVDDLERRRILEALEEFSGNKSRAARRLGISRQGLQLKMKRLGLKNDQ